MPSLPTAKIGIPAIASVLSPNIILSENAIIFDGNVYVTGLNGGDITTFTLNNATVTVPAFRHVILVISLEGVLQNAYVTPCTNRFTPVILKSSVGVAVIGVAYTHDGAATNQIYIRSFGTIWTEKSFENISNINDSLDNNNWNLNLLAAIDDTTHNLYVTFAYRSATQLSFTGVAGNSFVFPATNGESYQAIMRIQGSSGLISHNYIFNVPDTDFLGFGYFNVPGLSIQQMNTNGSTLHCLVSCDISANYYVDKLAGIGGGGNTFSIIQSTSKMALIEFTPTLGFQALMQNSLILMPIYEKNNLNYYNNTYLITPLTYVAPTQQTIAGKTVPATFTSIEDFVPKSMVALFHISDPSIWDIDVSLLDINLIAAPIVNGTTSVSKLAYNVSTLNNNVYITFRDIVSISNNGETVRMSFARYTVQNNTTLVKSYETTAIEYDESFSGGGSISVNIMYSNNYIYAVGNANNRILKQYRTSDGSLVYSKTLPTYCNYFVSASTETIDNALIVLGNITTTQTETYDYNVTFPSTAGATKTFFLKMSHQTVTISFDSDAFKLTISNIPKVSANGLTYFSLWMYATDSNNTVQTNPNMIMTLTGRGPSTSGSSYSQVFNRNIMPQRFAFFASLYINNTDVNLSEPIYGTKATSPIFTSNIIATNNLTTESTPATIKSALDTLTTNASSTTALTSNTESTSILIKKDTLNAAPDPLITLSKTVINNIRVNSNVYGLMTKAVTNFENDGSLSVSLALTKVDSAGNKITSDTANSATFDTVIVTLPKPINNVISVDRTVNGVTTNNVASINISTGVKTYMYSGQNLTILSQTSTTIKLQYIGPFSETTFNMGQTDASNFDDAASGSLTENPQPCLPTGTLVLTPAGYKKVETLETGDMVLTSRRKEVPVRVYKQHLGCTSKVTAPYLIPANTFGSNPPMMLSPDHAFKIGKDLWHIPQYAALKHKEIQQVGIGRPITYYHLETPDYFTDNLVINNGAVVEAFGAQQVKKGSIVYKYNEKRGGFTRNNGTFARTNISNVPRLTI